MTSQHDNPLNHPIFQSTKLMRVVTVPQTLSLLKGALRELAGEGYEVVAVSSPGERLETFGREEGVRTVGVPMERHISPLRDLRSLWRLYRVLRRERPDIVHSMTPKAGMLTMVAGRLAGVPTRVHTFTGLVFPTATGLKRRVLMATDRLTCACATHVIPEGEGVKNDLLKHNITRKPLRVLGHGNIRGIDLEYYSPRLLPKEQDDALSQPAESVIPSPIPSASEGERGDGMKFVFVGRIVGDKGINELVSAFARLHEELPDSELVLVGLFEERLDPVAPATRELIERNPGIRAVGRQSDVRPYYAAADALVFPSYREGFPNVVIEAGAMGLPAIVTDINGSREIIIEGRNGTIVPARDEEALFRAMRHWATHRDEVTAMAAQARELVASRYEQGYVRQCLKDFYRQIAGNRPDITTH